MFYDINLFLIDNRIPRQRYATRYIVGNTWVIKCIDLLIEEKNEDHLRGF